MSGGHFNYNQYYIQEVIEEIEKLIKNNNTKDKYGYSSDYPKDIINEFKNGIEILKKSYVYAQRIDWLVSGDDGEESFKKRLKEDLDKL